MSFCAPSRGGLQKNQADHGGGSAESATCFSVEELDMMAQAWNKTTLGKKFPIDLQSVRRANPSSEMYKAYLWNSLRERFFPFCGSNEACWLDSMELGKQLRVLSPKIYKMVNYFSLKPKGTKGKHDWLSTTEIDYVMQQYEQIYPDFRYIGCFPSDYYKLAPDKFPTQILDTVPRAAIVFNLDESHQKGSHWIAVFFDRSPNGQRIVEYFDPTGDKPIKNLTKFLEHPYFVDSIKLISRKRHQRGNNECGVYSLYYILERLKGKTFDEINGQDARRISDAEMNQFRANLFRPYTETF